MRSLESSAALGSSRRYPTWRSSTPASRECRGRAPNMEKLHTACRSPSGSADRRQQIPVRKTTLSTLPLATRARRRDDKSSPSSRTKLSAFEAPRSEWPDFCGYLACQMPAAKPFPKINHLTRCGSCRERRGTQSARRPFHLDSGLWTPARPTLLPQTRQR